MFMGLQVLQKLVVALPVADAVQVMQEGTASAQAQGALHDANLSASHTHHT